MKKGGGKRKGSSFERDISRKLSLWFSHGKRDDLFWRTHSSGALGTISKKKSQYGDIMSIDDEGKAFTDKCSIECRHGRCLNEKELLYPTKSSSILQLIQEGRKNASLSGRVPIWFFKSHKQQIMVMLENYVNFYNEPKFLLSCTECKILAIYPQHNIVLITFEEWCRCFDLEKYGIH